MENIVDLRKELTKLYSQVKGKAVKLPEAKTLVNTANCIIKTTVIEMNHKRFIGDKRPIAFLNEGKK